MIPVSLTLQGIFSYREKQTISFEPLTHAGIFGIFGAVGSGKSTILEAISFALYGEAERLNKRDDRAYNMMNLQSKELFIDFIFRNGADDAEYRFMVRGKRNRKNFDKVTTLDRTAYKKTAAGWEPADPGQAESILQLSYENFRRTVIIPQGKFQEFLELTDSERTRMMKELFHLQKFELSEKVSVLERLNNEQLIRLEERIQQTGTATQEQLTSMESELQGLVEGLEKINLQLTSLQKSEQQYAQLKKLFDKIHDQRMALQSLYELEEKMKALGQHITRFEYCQLHYKPLLDKRRELNASAGRQSGLLKKQRSELQQVLSELHHNETLFQKAKDVFENRVMLQARSDELEKLILLRQIQLSKESLNNRIKSGTSFLQKRETEIAALQAQQHALHEKIRQIRDELPDVLQLSAVNNWFIQKSAYERAIQQMLMEQKAIEEKISILAANAVEQITPQLKNLLTPYQTDATAQGLIRPLQEVLSHCENDLVEKENDLRHIELRSQLAVYASDLRTGEPCPLCGAVHHPNIYEASGIKQHLKKAHDEVGALKNKISEIAKAIRQLEIIQSDVTSLSDQLLQWQSRLQKEEAVLQQHLSGFEWPSFRDLGEKSVQQSLAAAASRQNELKSLEQQLSELVAQTEELVKKKESARSKLDALTDELTTLSAQYNLLESQLKLVNLADYEDSTPAMLQQEIQSLAIAFTEAEKNYRELDNQLQQLRKSESELKGAIAAGTTAQLEYHNAIRQVEENLKRISMDSGMDEESATALLESGLNVSEARNEVSVYQQQLHTAKKMLEESERDASGKVYEEDSHHLLIETIRTVSLSQEQHIQNRATLTSELSSLKKQMTERSELLAEQQKVQLRSDDLLTLKNLFKASGFVNYVSTVHLQQLCRAANERFYKFTRQKLRLEVNDNNNFMVCDYMNNGQQRSIKTLSGGQKFQAALALALALADSIQAHSRSRQNFFFLDEGFGSLDAESLETVFETMRSLRKENRIVGIISHVQDMMQEIDTCLTIVNKEETGSIIFTSY